MRKSPKEIASLFGELDAEDSAVCFQLIIREMHEDGLLVDLLNLLDKSHQDILNNAVLEMDL
jgi:hypothetical protein